MVAKDYCKSCGRIRATLSGSALTVAASTVSRPVHVGDVMCVCVLADKNVNFCRATL